MNLYPRVVTVIGIALGGCSTDVTQEPQAGQEQAIMAGAGFTTFDSGLGGCKNGNGNGINCNSYDGKDYVYMNGGPAQSASGLADGSYYFTVLVPGSQLTGLVDFLFEYSHFCFLISFTFAGPF